MRKNIKARIICVLLLFAMLLSLAPMSAIAAPSVKTDADFFAKLNLSTAGMESVKTAVDAGNYTSAKTALLTYYKNKFANYKTTVNSIGGHYAAMAMRDTFAYLERPMQAKISRVPRSKNIASV